MNATDGALLWSFDASRVRPFPVALNEPTATALPAPAAYSARPYARSGAISARQGYGQQLTQLDYLELAQLRGMNPYGMQPRTQFALAHSAAAWAGADANRGQMRFGLLDGERMLLLNGYSLRTVRLDVPFGGVIPPGGRRVHRRRRPSCVPAELRRSHGVRPGFQRNRQHPDFSNLPMQPRRAQSAQTSAISVQAAVDAPLIHVSGPDGLTTYHARTPRARAENAVAANVAPPPQPAPAGGRRTTCRRAVHLRPKRKFLRHRALTATVRDGVLYVTVPRRGWSR